MSTNYMTDQQVADSLLDQMHGALIVEVEEYLREEGINRTEFAQQLGVSKGYVSQFLNGTGRYSLRKLVAVSMAIRRYPHIVFTEAHRKRHYAMPEATGMLVQENEQAYGQPGFLRGIDLHELQTYDLLQELTGTKKSIDVLRPLSEQRAAQLLQKFRYAWNFNSNAIEGNQLTYGETITLIRQGLTAKGKPLKDHLDVQGHEAAVDMMLELIQGKRPLTQNDIRQLHQLLLKDNYQSASLGPDGQYVFRTINVGTYKKQPNHVRTADGSVHYYADPIEVPARVADLLTWYDSVKNSDQLHPLVVAAIFHHEFVAIHPFDDGNGRMGRILMNYTLMRRGYPPIVVPLKKRKEYYNVLNRADLGDHLPLLEYLGQNLEISLKVMLDGARNGGIRPYEWEES